MTPLQSHRQRWQDCADCPLFLVRNNVVLYRGTVPCDVLFIGEGPGTSEDRRGIPFYGPAGKLLDRIIDRAWENAGSDATRAFTNLIACIPKDQTGNKVSAPPNESIEACAPRLQEFVKLCQPGLIVHVGSIAAKNTLRILDTKWRKEGKTVDIVHPAALLRMNISQRPLEIQKCTVALAEALEEL